MTIYHIPAQFTASRVGVDGLTILWSVDRVTRADGTRSALVTDAANAVTYGRFGLYGYLLDMDLTTYDYLVTAKSTSAIVDMKELTTFWTSTEAAGISSILTAIAAIDNGNGGALSLVYTVYVAGVPVEGATVKLFSDSGRTSLINAKVSDVLGVCTFTNLVAGTYYLTVQLSGYEDLFDSEVVA